MNFKVTTEVGFDIDSFAERILSSFDDYVYDLDYEEDYVLLSKKQKTELKIAIFKRAIEETLEEEEED
jgi:hypothetical protein